MKTLTTDRLTLRNVLDEDVPLIASLLGDEGRTRYLFAGTTMSPAQTLAFIKQYFTGKDAETGMGTLVTSQPERIVGFAGIIPTDCLGGEDYEFGFALLQWAERKNYPAEIGLCQMQYAFDVLKLSRILALAHPDNSASVYILRNKLQMTEIARWAGDMHRGPRIVFCRRKIDGLPEFQGRG